MMGDWERLVVPQVFLVISSKLPQRDICALASINRFTRRLLLSHPTLWKVLDLHGMNRVGERLAKAINLPHFSNVEEINLEFAQGLEDNDLQCLQKRGLQSINLNACQKITDLGLRIVARSSPGLKHFSIYWNLKMDGNKEEGSSSEDRQPIPTAHEIGESSGLAKETLQVVTAVTMFNQLIENPRITDAGVMAILENCEGLISLNLSGCKRVTDKSLEMMSARSTCLTELNLTRCLSLTDDGLSHFLENCRGIQVLYLYAVSSFTDKSYEKLANLKNLRVLDLCGAQMTVFVKVSPIVRISNL
ncbi:hypothetical protein L7F22_021002 [Adiantum nelumboides]|nr:hypothetical protein [Adiantum nelumboides]